MSQEDYILADAAAPTFRADLNAQLDAIATLNSGATAPATTFANMWWFDTANELLKMRNADNTAWVTVAAKTATAWAPAVNGDLLGTTDALDELGLELVAQAEAEAGVATTARRWTAERIAQAIDAQAPSAAGDFRTYGSGITLDPFAYDQDLSQAHGLGANPDNVEMYLECLTAEHGWAVGDRYHLGMLISTEALIVGWTATTVYLRVAPSSATSMSVLNKVNGGLAIINAARWKLVVTPYLFA